VGPRNHVLDGGALWRNPANTIEPSKVIDGHRPRGRQSRRWSDVIRDWWTAINEKESSEEPVASSTLSAPVMRTSAVN